MTATISVQRVNKIIPEGAPVLSANTLAYGQLLSAITLSGSMGDGDTAVPGTFAWGNPGDRPAVQEPYDAAWVFTPGDSSTYAAVSGVSVIKVVPAPITDAVIVLDRAAFRYDGAEHLPALPA